jgi:predicted TPR repeat methyltransferase
MALRPAQPAALVGCGRVLRKLHRHAEALACFDALLALDATSTEALAQRAQLLSLLARDDPQHREAAVQAIRAALPYSHAPEDAHYALASLGAEPMPSAAPRRYVTSLFDEYAERFDAHLTGVLRYRTPELIAQAVQQAGAPPPGLALDLGCGTGLCGPWMRPLASRLVGVDLSQKMLDKAGERGLYDELACVELVDYLTGVQREASLVVAADVFVYVGDLQPVFAACARVQPAGALFAFSVESLPQGDYLLRETRRYAHGRGHVAQLAASQGYAVVSEEATALRQETGVDVMGLLFVLRRGA